MLPQKLTIDTPEQISLEYEIAGPGSRFLALFVDIMLQVVAGIVLAIVFFIIAASAGKSVPWTSNWVIALIILGVFSVQWGYFAGFEIFWNGQTPGKRHASIRVINETGRQVSAYETITRNLLRAVDSLPGVYAVGAIVMFISPQHKRIGDYVAGTIVIHDRNPEEQTLLFNTERDEIAESINYSLLSATDIEVIEAFLQRRLELDYEVRQRTAIKLSGHFRQKCSVPPELHRDNEDFLEMLVRGFRRSARFHGR